MILRLLVPERASCISFNSLIKLPIFLLLTLALVGCHDENNSVEPFQFSEFSSQAGSEPETVALTFQCDGGPAHHVFVEFDPDGTSGFRQADINGDGVIDEKDQIDPANLAVEFPIPPEITNFDNALFRMVAVDSVGNVIGTSDPIVVTDVVVESIITYIKASNTDAFQQFGMSVALSGSGDTLAVGAIGEASAATGINGDQTDNSAALAGAVYVFTRDEAGNWSQQAYIKASNTDLFDRFGTSVALSGNGDTLAVGAQRESSAATGINGDETDNSASSSGAAYVFTRDQAGNWSQQAYIKASNTDPGDRFGFSVALAGSGDTLAVGAQREASAATGIDGDQTDNSATNAGAVYVFTRDQADNWSQQAYIKASNTDTGDLFGTSVALASDGATLAVGAIGEASAATGINGDQTDNSAGNAGAVYVFTRDQADNWSQQAYIKASNTDAGDLFGRGVALSGSGDTLAVGAPLEASAATGINGDETDNSAAFAGAVYVFTRMAEDWLQQAYIKASNTDADDNFGESVALDDSGDTLVVGAPFEASAATGIDGDETDNSSRDSGAVYRFTRESQSWSQQAYVKASNTRQELPEETLGDNFGFSVALDGIGDTLAVGARNEASAATGINGDQTDNSASGAGAVYVYE